MNAAPPRARGARGSTVHPCRPRHRQEGDHDVDGQVVPMREAGDDQELDDEGSGHGDDRSSPRAGGDDEAQDKVHRQIRQELALIRGRQARAGGSRGPTTTAVDPKSAMDRARSGMRRSTPTSRLAASSAPKPWTVPEARGAPPRSTPTARRYRTPPTQAMIFVLVIAGATSQEGDRAVRRARGTRWSVWHPSRDTIQPPPLRDRPADVRPRAKAAARLPPTTP